LQAFFCHQLGSLGLCLGRLDNAARLLQHALAVRERIGDLKGAGFYPAEPAAWPLPLRPPAVAARSAAALW
jgi:hypothetical protein